MTHLNFIKHLLKILDPNITLSLPDDTVDIDSLPTIKIKNTRYIQIDATLDYMPECCPHCGCRNHNHSIVRRSSKMTHPRHSILKSNQIRLNLRKTQFFCKECGRYFLAATSFVRKHHQLSRYTQSLIQTQLGEVRACSNIARDAFVSPSTVHRIVDELAKLLNKKHPLPRTMCIDEVNLISSKYLNAKMSATIMDGETHEITHILPDRRLSELSDYFRKYDFSERQKVKYFVTDMHLPYIRLGEQLFPNAQIIIDRFHIVQLLNRSLDNVRKEVMNLYHDKDLHAYKKLKKFHKLLWKADDKLEVTKLRSSTLFEGLMTESMIVEHLLHLSERLRVAYEVTHGLREAIAAKDVAAFLEVLEEVKKKRLPRAIRNALKTIQHRLPYILNSIRYPYSNGPLEGTHLMIKNLKRSGYGYRRFSRLSARSKWIQSTSNLWKTSEKQRKEGGITSESVDFAAGS